MLRSALIFIPLTAQRLKLLQSLSGHRFLCLHHLNKRVKEIGRIVRTGARFGMVLHAENRELAMTESLDGSIVEIDVRDNPAVRLQGLLIDREAVVLTGDFDAPRIEVLHGLIAA